MNSNRQVARPLTVQELEHVAGGSSSNTFLHPTGHQQTGSIVNNPPSAGSPTTTVNFKTTSTATPDLFESERHGLEVNKPYAGVALAALTIVATLAAIRLALSLVRAICCAHHITGVSHDIGLGFGMGRVSYFIWHRRARLLHG
jgi:hypothetical protein